MIQYPGIGLVPGIEVEATDSATRTQRLQPRRAAAAAGLHQDASEGRAQDAGPGPGPCCGCSKAFKLSRRALLGRVLRYIIM